MFIYPNKVLLSLHVCVGLLYKNVDSMNKVFFVSRIRESHYHFGIIIFNMICRICATNVTLPINLRKKKTYLFFETNVMRTELGKSSVISL